MRGRLYYCDHHSFPLPEGHRFHARKYRLLREALSGDDAFDIHPAPQASLDLIRLAHERQYVHRFLNGTLDPAAMRRIGFPWSPELVLRILASVGGTLAAADHALNHGWAGNLAGGTHHAFRAEGSGYCIFNDIAVSILALRKRSAVVDLDVHQGDGTAAFFEDDPLVFTLSIHGGNNFPFRKRRSSLDVAMPDGAGDDIYLRALEESLPKVIEFKPEIVFYQSGVDALEADQLGRLSLTHAGLRRRDEIVLASFHQAGVPVVITLGGGYSSPIEATVEAHANTFRMAAGRFTSAG